MPFEKEFLNLGGGMNLASGVFTAPKAGIYAFTFKGIGAASGLDVAGYGILSLQRNSVGVALGVSIIKGATEGTLSTLSVHATLKLNKGDAITIRLEEGAIHSGGGNDSHFTGSLIEEELLIS